MFTDNYLDARAIQYYFETKTQGLCSAALLHDEYNEGHSAYVVYVNITMEDYKELLVTAESAATGGEIEYDEEISRRIEANRRIR